MTDIPTPDAIDPVLTPRMVLTPVGPADLADLLVLYGDPEVACWTGPWTPESVAGMG